MKNTYIYVFILYDVQFIVYTHRKPYPCEVICYTINHKILTNDFICEFINNIQTHIYIKLKLLYK